MTVSSTLDTTKVLYDMLVSANACEAHTTGKGIFGDNDASFVISVYREQRPSHEILDDLVEWLETTNERVGRKMLLNKITKLASLDQ